MARCAACGALLDQSTGRGAHEDLDLIGHIVTPNGDIARYQCQTCRTVWQLFIPSSPQVAEDDVWKPV